MDSSSRMRPARYRQATTEPQQRVPPRYIRGDDLSEAERQRMQELGVREVFRGLSFLVIGTLLFLTAQRFLFEDGRDPYKCAAVVNEGRWLETWDLDSPPLEHWQPPGCLMHNYKSSDITTCLPNRRLLFVGDLHIKSIFYAAVCKLSPNNADFSKSNWEADEQVSTGGVTVQFVWDPYLNSTKLKQELKPWINGTVDTSQMGDYESPAIFVVGAGFLFASKEFENGMHHWREAVDAVASHMRWGIRPTYFGGRDLLMLAPASMPAWEKLSKGVRDSVTPTLVSDMNKYLGYLSAAAGLDILRSWRVTSDDKVDLVVSNHIYNKYQKKATGDDGMTWLPIVTERRLDQILNVRCNAVLKRKNRGWEGGTCCVKYEKPNWIQILVLLSAFIGIPALRIWKWKYPSSVTGISRLSGSLLKHAWYFFLVLAFCFYADRTPIFNKAQQFYTTSRFLNPLIVVFVASLFTLRKPEPTISIQEFESRVADEWKGAALIIHLASLYLGGSVRFSTFALLLVHSVEHTIAILRAGEISLYWVVNTLVRLNVLAIPLVFMMKSEYTLYELPALYSFWFLVIIATLQVSSARNRHLLFLVTKLCISACIVTVFFTTPQIYTAFFALLSAVFGIHWSAEEARRLVLMHLWGVYIGVFIGAGYLKLLHLQEEVRERYERYASTAAASLAFSYPLFIQYGTGNWESYYTYTSLARIAQFGLMRLGTSIARGRQSTLLMFLGSMSIEALSLVNHAWLAADGRGVLEMGFWGQEDLGVLLNWVACTWIFLYFCWVQTEATWTIVGGIVGREEEGGTRGGGGLKLQGDVGQEKREKSRERALDDIEEEDFAAVTGTNGGEGQQEIWERASTRRGVLGGLKGRLGMILGLLWVLNLIS
ncbi:hypothetical protein ABW19_dt0203242 [Dactylella cylindrospora]|nr:hypothetical protein ABW19_dt0203242 [Dactylella cylindrospora]